MNGPQLIEMAQVAEQEHMMNAVMARARAQQRRQLGPGRVARAWTAFWAPRDVQVVFRRAADNAPTDLTPCADC
jgi:hypothetical protein